MNAIRNALLPIAFAIGIGLGWLMQPPEPVCASHHYLRGHCVTQAYVDSLIKAGPAFK